MITSDDGIDDELMLPVMIIIGITVLNGRWLLIIDYC